MEENGEAYIAGEFVACWHVDISVQSCKMFLASNLCLEANEETSRVELDTNQTMLN